MKEKLRDGLFITGMVLSWTAYYSVSKWAVDFTASAFLAGLLLRAAAFCFLTVYLIASRKFLKLFKIGKPALLLLIIGILGFLLDTFANIGFKHGSVTTGTALLKTDILMGNLATALILKQKLYPVDWIGSAVMLAGVIMVLDIDFSAFAFNWYDLFFILSALGVTVNAFLIKGAQNKLNLDADHIGYCNNFVVMFLFLVSALISGDFGALGSANFGVVEISLILLGGLAQSLLYLFYYRNLKRFPVWQVKLYLLFVPVASCIAGIFAFGERPTPIVYVGIATVVAGAALIILRNKLTKSARIGN